MSHFRQFLRECLQLRVYGNAVLGAFWLRPDGHVWNFFAAQVSMTQDDIILTDNCRLTFPVCSYRVLTYPTLWTSALAASDKHNCQIK